MRPPDKLKRLLRSVWEAGSETLLAIAVVLLLSSILLGSLLVLFPKGTELVDLYGGLVDRQHRAPAGLPFAHVVGQQCQTAAAGLVFK